MEVKWTGSSATMCEKHIFSDPASSHKGVISTKRKPQTGIATFQFIPRSQCKNNLISQRVHSISFHKGHASLNFFFCKAGLVWWVGPGTEKEELQHLISKSHKGSAKINPIARNCFLQCLAWPLKSPQPRPKQPWAASPERIGRQNSPEARALWFSG